MNVSCSLKGIVNRERPGQGLDDIKRAEFADAYLDLSMYCTEDELERTGKEQVRQDGSSEIKKVSDLHVITKSIICKMADIGLKCVVMKVPHLRRDTKREDLNGTIYELAKESVKICGMCGCAYLVVCPLFAGVKAEDIWEVNRKFYMSLATLAKENHVTILLENQCKDINGHLVRGICADGSSAVDWVDKLNEEAGEERFGFCMDVGACNLCGQNIYDFACALGRKLKAVVVRDCNGNEEGAMLPFTCVSKRQSRTDWLNFVRGMRKIGFDGQLIINLEDTAAVFSPMLRPTLLQLAKAVGEYFKWQIEMERLLIKYPMRVLFGAGNMCRNYMKCYGEEYTPLFTCDNNKKLWGTWFCGLEVKSPESLKELPKDCAIFICNIYYREIAEQLRNMGIQNPIEYFNDEYMPTFYVDRLKNGGN